MNRISNHKPANKPATKTATEQIIVAVTKKQHCVISKLCQRYRITPSEMAKSAFLHSLYQDEENWQHILTDATTEEASGVHPAWKNVEKYVKENLD